MKNPFDRNIRVIRLARYLLLVAFAAFVFSTNGIQTASEFQFRTYRDGSEALVLGKILADAEGIPTGRVNLGFIEKDKLTQGSDVLGVYERLNYRNSIIPKDISDANWKHGIATFDTIFLLARADVAELGYASNELLPGQQVRFSNGETRNITKIELKEKYLHVYYSGEKLDGDWVGYPNVINTTSSDDTLRYKFDPYDNQYGLQAIIFSWLYNHVSLLQKVERLQLVAALLFSIVLVMLCREFQIAFPGYSGSVFYICMLGSPWVVSVVRNLYWVPVLWLLPALVAMWLYRSQSKAILRRYLYAGFFLAVFIKCLTGYEYLPTILLFATAVFFVEPFQPSSRYGFAGAARIITTLFLISLGAFLCAFIVHASIRADSLIQGMQFTFERDVFRYSSLSHVLGYASRGTEIPLVDVVKQYIFNWNTPVLYWTQKITFPLLIAAAIFSIFLEYVVADKYRHRDAALLVIMLLASISWLVLMKGHSVIHTHLNYVLWYFGFIPALVLVALRGAMLSWHGVKKLYSTYYSKTAGRGGK